MFGFSLANTFMPVKGTDLAGRVDDLYSFLLISSLISFVILIGGMTYFILKYKRKTANDKTAYITHNTALEFLWSFIPFVIMMVIFYWGKVLYDEYRIAPENAEEIHVRGSQWMWQFTYKNGYTFGTKPEKTADVLRVPLNKPIKLVMSSADVIHSFFIPGFRNKQDVVPGRYSFIWFQATKLGDYQVFCTEFCGLEHSNMPATIRVMPEAEYNAWYGKYISSFDNYEKLTSIEKDEYKKYYPNHVPAASLGGLAERGKEVFGEKACAGCHNVANKDRLVGPTMVGLFGSKREFSEGPSVVADENYLRESILLSGAKIVKGYPAAMPIFKGQIPDEDLNALIDYIKSLK
jgi:cytochrome c oxidase subunit II